MRHTPNKLNQSGFTIVETIIVLAVAGLMLLLIFYAIPSLQRNGRNNQRKQDVSTLLQAVSHYEVDNSANFPPSVVAMMKYSPQGLNLYTVGNVHLNPGPTAATPVLNTDDVEIYNFETCSTSTIGSTNSQGADYSNIVALYAVEGGGGAVSECQQS